MTWISDEQSGMLNPLLNKAKKQPFQAGLLQWLQTPQAQGLIMGLGDIAQASPYPRGLNESFGAGVKHTNELNKTQISQDELAERIRHNKAQEALDALRSKEQNLTGIPQEIASLDAICQRYGEDSEQCQMARAHLNARLESQKSLITTRESVNAIRPFNSMTASEKGMALAQARALGYSQNEAMKAFSLGLTLEDMARAKGLDPSVAQDISPQYPATTATITGAQTARGAQAEEKILGNYIEQNTKDYSRTYFGYSPKQVIDAFKKDKVSVDKQAKFLAARALAAEQAAIRARLANASNAQQALIDLKSLSLNEFKIFQPFVAPEVYGKAQQEIDRVLQEMANARVYAMTNPGYMAAQHPEDYAEANPAPKITNPKFTPENILFTAKKYGLTVEEVKKRLGIE